MTELLAHNARASQASLHGQFEGHGWGGNGRLRRPGKGHAKGPRRDEVVTDINSILRLCAVLDTTDLDRALTRAFTTAIMQAYQAYARRASDPAYDLAYAQQWRVRERNRSRHGGDLGVARTPEVREKFAHVWLTRQLIEIVSSFRNARREIEKIKN